MVVHTDIRHLSEVIDSYNSLNGHDPYIFMNKRTFEELNSLLDSSVIRNFAYDLQDYNSHSMVYEFEGYKVFEDNTLDFLEVELR